MVPQSIKKELMTRLSSVMKPPDLKVKPGEKVK